MDYSVHNIIPRHIFDMIPRLYTTRDQDDPVVQAKFTDGNDIFLITECDSTVFYGYKRTNYFSHPNPYIQYAGWWGFIDLPATAQRVISWQPKNFWACKDAGS